jgi:hypothetical protein
MGGAELNRRKAKRNHYKRLRFEAAIKKAIRSWREAWSVTAGHFDEVSNQVQAVLDLLREKLPA